MPSTSPTGSVTTLSVAASDAVDLLRGALERAHAAEAPFTSEGLSEFWPVLPIPDLVEAMLGRVRPASHLSRALRDEAVVDEVIRKATWCWGKFRAEPFTGTVRNPGGDHRATVEQVAGQYVDDLCGLIGMFWRAAHEEASENFWADRAEGDGRVTIGTSKSGRRQRRTPQSLEAEDAEHSWKQAQKAGRDVSAVTRCGMHRRLARVARLRAGWTQQQAQYATRVTFGWNGWENKGYVSYTDGVAEQPRGFAWEWPNIASVFGLDPAVGEGPMVPSVHCPVMARVQHERWSALGHSHD